MPRVSIDNDKIQMGRDASHLNKIKNSNIETRTSRLNSIKRK